MLTRSPGQPQLHRASKKTFIKTILVTGPDGDIGGRLAKGYKVRCLTRRPDHLSGLPWAGSVEIYKGDVYKNEGLEAALAVTDAAYYLVHSMLDVPVLKRWRSFPLSISRKPRRWRAAAGWSI